MKTIRSVVAAAIAVACLIIPASHDASSQFSFNTEEYSVYSALATRMSASDQIKLAVIKQETVSYKLDPAFLKEQNLTLRWPLLAQATVDDYIAKNQQARELSGGFNIKLPFAFFTRQDEELFKAGDGWEIFNRRYPGSFGYITFSTIGFNPEMDQALVYVTRACGLLCGSGHLVVLTKHNGMWDSQEWLMLWVA